MAKYYRARGKAPVKGFGLQGFGQINDGAALIDIGANLTKNSHNDAADQLARAAEAGVGAVLVTGCDLTGSRKASSLCKWWWATHGDSTKAPSPRLYFTAGIHPHDASKAGSGPDFISALEELASTPLCVAIGECGLDYDRMHSPRDVQLRVFEAQCALAAKLEMPLFTHCREAGARSPQISHLITPSLTFSHLL